MKFSKRIIPSPYQTSVNPMILFGNSNAIVDNCVLGEVYDVNQDDSTVGNIIMQWFKISQNNVIDSWGLKTKTILVHV